MGWTEAVVAVVAAGLGGAGTTLAQFIWHLGRERRQESAAEQTTLFRTYRDIVDRLQREVDKIRQEVDTLRQEHRICQEENHQLQFQLSQLEMDLARLKQSQNGDESKGSVPGTGDSDDTQRASD